MDPSTPPTDIASVPVRILRMPDVKAATGISKATIHRLRKNGAFPEPVRLGERAVGWRSVDVEAWIADREPIG